MDIYSGYNQIAMDPINRTKIAFMEDASNFYYNVMPFRLKNMGEKYQRMMNKAFKYKIRRRITLKTMIYHPEKPMWKTNSRHI